MKSGVTTAQFPTAVSQPQSPFWWLRWFPAIVCVVVTLYFVYVIGSVAMLPLLASFALAYLLNPIVLGFERRGISRAVAAILTLMGFTLVIVAFLTFVVPDLLSRGADAGQKLARYFTPENALRQRLFIRRYSPIVDRIVGNRVEQVLRDPVAAIGPPSTWFAGGLSGFLASAVASLDLLLVPFFVFYLLLDFGKWRVAFEDLIPPRFRAPFSRLFDEVGRILEAYVRGQILIASCMAILYAIGFAALGVPAWAGIAALAGLLNAIPYVGTILGVVLATGFTVADGGGPWRIGGIVAVFATVQCIEGYFLTPRILGARLNLHPMAVFLGLLIGGKLFGLLGVILVIPVIAVAKVFLMFFREIYKGSLFYHNDDLAPSEVPSPILEERMAEAAETVLAEQVNASTGDELLIPDQQDDDPISLQPAQVN